MAEEIRQTNRMDTKEIMPTLSTYLPRIRRAVVSSSALKSSQQPSSHVNRTTIDAPKGGTRTTLVMGNPSADLDSFVSAVVLSYFYNLRSSQSRMMGDDDRANNKNGQTSDRSRSKSKSRIYVPILNLPGVRANELWRLRPEFGVALRLALGETTSRIGRVEGGDDIGDQNSSGGGGGKAGEEGNMNLLEDVITIADVLADRECCLHGVFVIPGHAGMGTKASDDSADEQEKQELFLVDHNAPSIAIHGMTEETIRSRFDVVGCIDHHVDEGYVPNDADPRIVRTGIGSCTSLVVRHLRDEGLWPSSSSSFSSHSRESDQGDGRRQGSDEVDGDGDGLKQIARLALAPVLIDTSNLKATGDKCSDLDREVVRFLESFIVGDDQAAAVAQGNGTRTSSETKGQAQGQGSWDRDAFHRAISTTKTNSLNLLNMQEIFDRDYKSWTEEPQTSSSEEEASEAMVNIGISSLVKPLSWLVEHAGGVDKFLDEIERFARDEDRKLGVFAMLTRAGDGKEVVVLAMDESVRKVIEKFEARGEGELKLRTWQEDGTVIKALDERLKKGEKGGWKIWWMGDTSKSRKQVGPLIREAVRNI